MQVYDIPIDEARRETTLHGSYEFPLALYTTRISKNVLGFVNWHWHEEVQFCLVTEGEVSFRVNHDEVVARAGEGIFINAGQLHTARNRPGHDSTYLCLDVHPRLLAGFAGGAIQLDYVDPYVREDAPAWCALAPTVPWQAEALGCLREVAGLLDAREAGAALGPSVGDAPEYVLLDVAVPKGGREREGATGIARVGVAAPAGGAAAGSEMAGAGAVGAASGSATAGDAVAAGAAAGSELGAFARAGSAENATRYRVYLTVLRLWGLVVVNFLGAAGAQTATSSLAWERVRAMLNYIDAHYSEAVTLSDVADAVSLARGTCCREFRQHMGCTVFSYLNDVRLSQAARLLVEGNASVTEVALACGFGSASYFIKLFRQKTGSSPGAYRRARRGAGV